MKKPPIEVQTVPRTTGLGDLRHLLQAGWDQGGHLLERV
jgi:hypothetical protein